MAWVGLQMRVALVTTVYKKTLLVSSTLLSAKFSIGEIVNFMSTDTDRIVNSCPSFHALWSTPFQVRKLLLDGSAASLADGRCDVEEAKEFTNNIKALCYSSGHTETTTS